jgi:hypothetical protein
MSTGKREADLLALMRGEREVHDRCRDAVAMIDLEATKETIPARRPRRIYYCATGVETPMFEPCKEMKDQSDI